MELAAALAKLKDQQEKLETLQVDLLEGEKSLSAMALRLSDASAREEKQRARAEEFEGATWEFEEALKRKESEVQGLSLALEKQRQAVVAQLAAAGSDAESAALERAHQLESQLEVLQGKEETTEQADSRLEAERLRMGVEYSDMQQKLIVTMAAMEEMLQTQARAHKALGTVPCRKAQ